MLTNDLMLGGVYLLMAIMLVAGALMARREPAAKLFTMALAWIAIFAAGFVLFTFRDNLGWVAQRLRAEALGTTVQQGQETRVPMAIDGHFWVEAKINGHGVKFLVDSGATTTTIDRATAKAAGVEVSARRDLYVRTGNGVVRVASGRARDLAIGGIVRHDVGLEIADNDNLNVLGMNFLSSLRRWGVEGRWLIMVP
jgi:aspartyl protease family protein